MPESLAKAISSSRECMFSFQTTFRYVLNHTLRAERSHVSELFELEEVQPLLHRVSVRRNELGRFDFRILGWQNGRHLGFEVLRDGYHALGRRA
jgi:hypothetical protein